MAYAFWDSLVFNLMYDRDIRDKDNIHYTFTRDDMRHQPKE